MWINPDTQAVYLLHSDIRRAYPHVSFPSQISEDDIASVGLKPVLDTERPFDDGTKVISEEAPRLVDGVWRRQWKAEEATRDVIALRIAKQWSLIRGQRNGRLTASDWTQLPDAPVDQQAWALYRQALRDVPTQEDPFAIEWPVEPQM